MILHSISSRDLLIDAYKFYSRGDARAHDALKIIIDREEMTSAVLGCLNEAKIVEEQDKQNLYVQAACFGKKFHPGIAIDEFQSTCRLLRVLNICRSLNLDASSGLEPVLEQLIDMRKFNLAIWIVEWLKLEHWEAKILTRWTEHMIDKTFMRDEQVATKILERLGRNPLVPYADVANKAIERHRITLAIKLIENEGQSSKQIPLLLNLKQYDLVLAKALATCDSNLIYMAIFKLQESVPVEIKFLDLVRKHPLAFKYYCNFLAVSDIPKLIMISHSEGSKEEISLHLLDNRLESALSVSRSNKQEFIAHQIDLRIKLIKFQQDLKQIDPPPKTPTRAWTSLSVCETIINLIALGHSGRAKDCQRKFEVSDRKYRSLEQIAHDILPKLDLPTMT